MENNLPIGRLTRRPSYRPSKSGPLPGSARNARKHSVMIPDVVFEQMEDCRSRWMDVRGSRLTKGDVIELALKAFGGMSPEAQVELIMDYEVVGRRRGGRPSAREIGEAREKEREASGSTGEVEDSPW